MFTRSSQKPQNRIDTLVGADTVIKGDIGFSGGLRVDGVIIGNVRESGPKPGALVLSEQGRIEGAISVSHAVINGTVMGPVAAAEYVELQAKSRVTGDVSYKTLEMHIGAVVEGKLIYRHEQTLVATERQD
ncbi:cell shape determination protein CcmA [Novimethylophilus kurashikiensis]|uniref:Cell shape determination protein CcmA n=1 Tax=Novimethylophilus kurashikiensis TaxID=1825523 RepID=A0A2R5F6W5_9PROT|nr:polymer-forming cytoskeletal protein [Novimethylophilus kurashikiensis]GBG13980.1 cell shape determination protein CcmA [Novimethylophilus kurashikiensis]